MALFLLLRQMHRTTLVWTVLLMSGVIASHIYAPLAADPEQLDLLLPNDRPFFDFFSITTFPTLSKAPPPLHKDDTKPEVKSLKDIWKREVCPIGYTWVPASLLTQSNGQFVPIPVTQNTLPQTANPTLQAVSSQFPTSDTAVIPGTFTADGSQLPTSAVVAGTVASDGGLTTPIVITQSGGSVLTLIPAGFNTVPTSMGNQANPPSEVSSNPTSPTGNEPGAPTGGIFQASPTSDGGSQAASVPVGGAFTATSTPQNGPESILQGPNTNSIVTTGEF